MRLLTNLVAIFTLVILLVTPSVFSVNLVNFKPNIVGISVVDNSAKFGQFFKILKIENNNFEVEFKTFGGKPALYKNFLVVENKGQSKTNLRIITENQDVVIFFSIGAETAGPTEIELSPEQKIGLSLIVKPAVQSQTAEFSLELK